MAREYYEGDPATTGVTLRVEKGEGCSWTVTRWPEGESENPMYRKAVIEAKKEVGQDGNGYRLRLISDGGIEVTEAMGKPEHAMRAVVKALVRQKNRQKGYEERCEELREWILDHTT